MKYLLQAHIVNKLFIHAFVVDDAHLFNKYNT